MPAIQPERLKEQAQELAASFDESGMFLRKLHQLLEFYSERVNRPGQSGEPAPLINSYNVRPPVIRQIVHTIKTHHSGDPEQILHICDALWEEDNLECRLISSCLLGQVSDQYFDDVIFRVNRRLDEENEEKMVDAMLGDGLLSIREEDIKRVLDLVETWLNDETIEKQRYGFQALLSFTNGQMQEVLPYVYNLIQPFSLQIPQELRYHVRSLFQILARQSPSETTYLLTQSLSHPDGTDTAWLIRQCLSEFPEETQERLRPAIRERM